MNKYEFNATNLIAETFEERGVKFDVVSHHGIEQLLAGFSVDCGPNVIMRFISRDNDNDVVAGIFGLITNTPTEKRARVMDACNVLNHKIRYMKFYLDTDGDINVEYDFPMHSPDNGIGEMAFEIFARMMHILKSEYSIFMKALYSEEELDIQGHSIPAELMQRLQELRKMMEAQMTAAGVSDDEESDGESDDVKLDLDNLELVSSSDDIGITIGFSTNSWETLTEWAQRCGEKQIENSGHIIKEQLITASQLAAMPTGTALVMVDSQYKFIAHLPFYDEMYDNSKWKAPQYKPTASGRPFKSLDFEAMVKEIKKKQMESTLSGFSAERKTSAVPTGFPFFEEARSDGPMDIDSLVSRIDAKIAELEAEEEAERKKQGADKKHHVIITEGQSNRARIARVIASATGESLEKAAKRLAQFPVDIAFSTKSEAVKFAKDVTNAGGKATIKTS